MTDTETARAQAHAWQEQVMAVQRNQGETSHASH